jgi:UDP-N-acetylglucosamine:LPS N-acetylglucosamine transferase
MTTRKRFKNLNSNKGVIMNKKQQIQDLKNQANEILYLAKKNQAKILKDAKLKQEKLLNEVKQLESEIKMQIADKSISYFKNEISLDELNQFIKENLDLI